MKTCMAISVNPIWLLIKRSFSQMKRWPLRNLRFVPPAYKAKTHVLSWWHGSHQSCCESFSLRYRVQSMRSKFIGKDAKRRGDWSKASCARMDCKARWIYCCHTDCFGQGTTWCHAEQKRRASQCQGGWMSKSWSGGVQAKNYIFSFLVHTTVPLLQN